MDCNRGIVTKGVLCMYPFALYIHIVYLFFLKITQQISGADVQTLFYVLLCLRLAHSVEAAILPNVTDLKVLYHLLHKTNSHIVSY